jgi:hypothetical protein
VREITGHVLWFSGACGRDGSVGKLIGYELDDRFRFIAGRRDLFFFVTSFIPTLKSTQQSILWVLELFHQE